MLNVALLSALSYFICYTGNWMFDQNTSDRPIFIEAVTGLLLEDLQQGLIIGATLEAVFMGPVDIGGQISADHSVATVFAVVFATSATLDLGAALIIVVPIGILMGFVTMFVNNIFPTVFTTLMDKWALEGNERGLLIYLNFGVWLAKNLLFATIVFFGVCVGYNTVEAFVDSTPDVVMAGPTIYRQLLPIVGLALLMKTIWTKEIGIYYLLGFVTFIYTKLPIIAIAVVGIVIVVAIVIYDFEINRMRQYPIACTDRNDSGEELEDFLQ